MKTQKPLAGGNYNPFKHHKLVGRNYYDNSASKQSIKLKVNTRYAALPNMLVNLRLPILDHLLAALRLSLLKWS